jgi:uncharacterized protein (TIGR02611 family)
LITCYSEHATHRDTRTQSWLIRAIDQAAGNGRRLAESAQVPEEQRLPQRWKLGARTGTSVWLALAELPRRPDRHRRAGILADVKDLVRLLRRIAVTVVGTVILAVGVVLLVAPGPGLVVIALALAVFAIEYRWARRYLATVQAHARSAALKTAASRVATASAVLFGVGAIGLGVVLIFTDMLPLSGAGTGVGVAIGGLTVLVTVAYSVRELRRAEKTGEEEDSG